MSSMNCAKNSINEKSKKVSWSNTKFEFCKSMDTEIPQTIGNFIGMKFFQSKTIFDSIIEIWVQSQKQFLSGD